jgi:hypothetical protein
MTSKFGNRELSFYSIKDNKLSIMNKASLVVMDSKDSLADSTKKVTIKEPISDEILSVEKFK